MSPLDDLGDSDTTIGNHPEISDTDCLLTRSDVILAFKMIDKCLWGKDFNKND